MNKQEPRYVIYVRTKHKPLLPLLKKVAKKSGLTVIQTVIEPCSSIRPSPKLQELLRRSKRGEVDALLMARPPRNSIDLALVARALADGSLKELQVADPHRRIVDLDTHMRILLNLTSGIAGEA